MTSVDSLYYSIIVVAGTLVNQNPYQIWWQNKFCSCIYYVNDVEVNVNELFPNRDDWESIHTARKTLPIILAYFASDWSQSRLILLICSFVIWRKWKLKKRCFYSFNYILMAHVQDGKWSWLVCFSATLSWLAALGFVFSFGIFFPVFMDYFNESREKTGKL